MFAQITSQASKTELAQVVGAALGGQPDHFPDFTTRLSMGSQHVLTPSRMKHARTVMASIDCNLPLLLEGPAAVGKTSLISALAQRPDGTHFKLERVNNTATTTVQDYLGSFLPSSQGFTFQKGAL